jgi:hypothetical protein
MDFAPGIDDFLHDESQLHRFIHYTRSKPGKHPAVALFFSRFCGRIGSQPTLCQAFLEQRSCKKQAFYCMELHTIESHVINVAFYHQSRAASARNYRGNTPRLRLFMRPSFPETQ